MITTLSVLAYIIIGFIFVVVWAKFDRTIKSCATETWWLVLTMLYWPAILGFLLLCGILYPVKWLFHRITDEA